MSQQEVRPKLTEEEVTWKNGGKAERREREGRGRGRGRGRGKAERRKRKRKRKIKRKERHREVVVVRGEPTKRKKRTMSESLTERGKREKEKEKAEKEERRKEKGEGREKTHKETDKRMKRTMRESEAGRKQTGRGKAEKGGMRTNQRKERWDRQIDRQGTTGKRNEEKEQQRQTDRQKEETKKEKQSSGKKDQVRKQRERHTHHERCSLNQTHTNTQADKHYRRQTNKHREPYTMKTRKEVYIFREVVVPLLPLCPLPSPPSIPSFSWHCHTEEAVWRCPFLCSSRSTRASSWGIDRGKMIARKPSVPIFILSMLPLSFIASLSLSRLSSSHSRSQFSSFLCFLFSLSTFLFSTAMGSSAFFSSSSDDPLWLLTEICGVNVSHFVLII